MAIYQPFDKKFVMPRVAVQTFECGIHEISYKSLRPGCPMCELEREVLVLRDALGKLKNELALTHDQNVRLEAQNNFVFAIKEATALLDDEDMGFLKSVLYEWRDTKSLGLKPTHGGESREANGFIVMPRRGDPYAHLCTSVGGLAIAQYFDEAVNSVGNAKAMEHLVRGMAEHLPGTIRS